MGGAGGEHRHKLAIGSGRRLYLFERLAEEKLYRSRARICMRFDIPDLVEAHHIGCFGFWSDTLRCLLPRRAPSGGPPNNRCSLAKHDMFFDKSGLSCCSRSHARGSPHTKKGKTPGDPCTGKHMRVTQCVVAARPFPTVVVCVLGIVMYGRLAAMQGGWLFLLCGAPSSSASPRRLAPFSFNAPMTRRRFAAEGSSLALGLPSGVAQRDLSWRGRPWLAGSVMTRNATRTSALKERTVKIFTFSCDGFGREADFQGLRSGRGFDHRLRGRNRRQCRPQPSLERSFSGELPVDQALGRPQTAVASQSGHGDSAQKDMRCCARSAADVDSGDAWQRQCNATRNTARVARKHSCSNW